MYYRAADYMYTTIYSLERQSLTSAGTKISCASPKELLRLNCLSVVILVNILHHKTTAKSGLQYPDRAVF